MKPDEVSTTARLIAAATLLAGRDARSPVRPPPGAVALSERFLKTGLCGSLLAGSLKTHAGVKAWRLVERCVQPGIVSHYAYRKQRIEALCRGALAEGFRRVVVFGAGFDTLAWRLATEFPSVRFIEADLPGTRSAKLRAVPAEARPANLAFADIRDVFTETLSEGPVLMVVEGVAMYLTDAQEREFFEALAHSTPRVRVVFTFMERREDGISGFLPRGRLTELLLGLVGEPFLQSRTRDGIVAFLTDRGFSVIGPVLEFSPADTAKGELAVVFEKR